MRKLATREKVERTHGVRACLRVWGGGGRLLRNDCDTLRLDRHAKQEWPGGGRDCGPCPVTLPHIKSISAVFISLPAESFRLPNPITRARERVARGDLSCLPFPTPHSESWLLSIYSTKSTNLSKIIFILERIFSIVPPILHPCTVEFSKITP